MDNNMNNINTYSNNGGSEEKGGILWGILGCCIPLVGLILFLVWKSDKPMSAKSAGIGALVGVGISIISYIIILLVGGAAFMGM